MKLLLIEDEKKLSEALVYILQKNKYNVDAAYDGTTGLFMAESGIYDLLVIDRMLPEIEGVEIVKTLRSKGFNTPILILTAKDAIKDRVEGLDAGADDYLIKPFSTEELLSRLRALSRRLREPVSKNTFAAGKAEFDPLSYEVKAGNESIKLTIKEGELLEFLIRNKNQVVTREQILDRVWGFESDVEMNNIEIYIYYLRKKLNPEACCFRIDTVRGIGYTLKEDSNV